MRKYLPFIISAIVGASIWSGVGWWSGRVEAWDTSVYWKIGIPIMVIAIFFVAIVWPNKPWRWGVTAAVAQTVVGLVQAFPDINLWPLSLIAIGFISLPLIVSAYLGSIVKRKIIES